MALSRFAPRSVSSGCHGIVSRSCALRRCTESITTKSPKPRSGPFGFSGPDRLNIRLKFQLKSLVLPQHDVHASHVHALQVDAPVDEVARIVLHAHLAHRREQRVLVVAQLHRVDRDAGEEAAADPAEVHLPLHRPRELRLDRAAAATRGRSPSA